MINAKRKNQYISSLDRATTDLANRIFMFNESLFIIRDTDNTYKVVNVDHEVLYVDIHFFSVAHAVATCIENDDNNMNKILFFEEKFIKHLTDMTFYGNADKIDLYENSRMLALEYLWKIKNFTATKNYEK